MLIFTQKQKQKKKILHQIFELVISANIVEIPTTIDYCVVIIGTGRVKNHIL